MLSPTPVVLPTVLFRLGTAELLPEGLPAPQRPGLGAESPPDVAAAHCGPHRPRGRAAEKPAALRAAGQAVKSYLISAGVAAERLSTIGYGDTRPLYASPDARNRRVEVEQVP
ncbi:hypothetical protein LRS06_21275 [Hymenobacter sp. J193]|nr:hypothetical protein [Hymenobacter sp. J193]MCR5890261.1 hypothetical protein [Hymenobacter sp. J193]